MEGGTRPIELENQGPPLRVGGANLITDVNVGVDLGRLNWLGTTRRERSKPSARTGRINEHQLHDGPFCLSPWTRNLTMPFHADRQSCQGSRDVVVWVAILLLPHVI